MRVDECSEEHTKASHKIAHDQATHELRMLPNFQLCASVKITVKNPNLFKGPHKENFPLDGQSTFDFLCYLKWIMKGQFDTILSPYFVLIWPFLCNLVFVQYQTSTFQIQNRG